MNMMHIKILPVPTRLDWLWAGSDPTCTWGGGGCGYDFWPVPPSLTYFIYYLICNNLVLISFMIL